MSEHEPSRLVFPEPDMETVIRIGWITTIVALIVTIVSGIGEYRGWWNLVGEVGLTAGSIVTVLVGVGTLAASAGRAQVGGVRRAFEDNGETLTDIDGQLSKLDRLDDLDRVQFELDKQTGVLEDIRDLM